METPDTVIDNKVVRKNYPRDNRDEKLSFVFENDPNLCLVKNKIAIHFSVEIPEAYIPENGFAQKQFSILDIEVNSQLVSSNKAKFVNILQKNVIKMLILEENFSLTTGLLSLAILIEIISIQCLVWKVSLMIIHLKIFLTGMGTRFIFNGSHGFFTVHLLNLNRFPIPVST